MPSRSLRLACWTSLLAVVFVALPLPSPLRAAPAGRERFPCDVLRVDVAVTSVLLASDRVAVVCVFSPCRAHQPPSQPTQWTHAAGPPRIGGVLRWRRGTRWRELARAEPTLPGPSRTFDDPSLAASAVALGRADRIDIALTNHRQEVDVIALDFATMYEALDRRPRELELTTSTHAVLRVRLEGAATAAGGICDAPLRQ